MQIHELTAPRKPVNENLASFFGLNNPKIAAAWGQIGGELAQDLFARFNNDPKYANMPLAQRKLAIARDQNVQQIAEKKLEEWNKYLANLQLKNGASLTDQQYLAALLNWANPSLFNNKFSALDPVAKSQAQFHLEWLAKHKNDPVEMKKMLIALISDETARMIQVATNLKSAQSAINQTPQQKTTTQPATSGQAGQATAKQATAPGLPNPKEEQIFNDLVAKALKAQG